FTDQVLEQTGLLGMIGKAERGPAALEAIRKHQSVYLMAVGGSAYQVSKAIRAAKVVGFEDLGMEAIYALEVKDMPVTAAVDSQGVSVYETGPREWQARIGKIPVVVVSSGSHAGPVAACWCGNRVFDEYGRSGRPLSRGDAISMLKRLVEGAGFEIHFSLTGGVLRAQIEGLHDSFEISLAYWKEISEERRRCGAQRLLVIENLVEDGRPDELLEL